MKKKLDKVKLSKEISRDRIGKVPGTRKIENKKKDSKEFFDDWGSVEGYDELHD
jgi:hypothetical protein